MKKKSLKFIYLLFLIPIIIFAVQNNNVDNDIWFLLNHGRYVIQNGIPYIEPFTIHNDLSFVMQQWLSSVIFYLSSNIFGDIGLYFIIILVGILIIFMFYKLCVLVSSNKSFSIIMSVLLSISLKLYIVSRPQIFTYLILIIELYLLEKYIKTANKKNLLFLPLLSILLVNLHASMWMLQFAFVLPFILNGFKIKKFKINKYDVKPIVLISLIMIVVGLINPYGYKAMLYVFNSYGVNYINSYVSEMAPLMFANDNCKLLLLCLFVIIFCFNFFRKRKVEFRHICLLFGTTLMAFINTKSLPYFFIIYFYVISYFFKNLFLNKIYNFKINKYIKSLLVGLKSGLYLMLIASVIYTFANVLPSFDYENDLKETADIILKDSNVNNIKLFVGYNDGGYMEYRGIKSYIDPRAEVFLKKNNGKEDIMKELVSMEKEDFNYEQFIKKYNFTHFVVYPNDNFDKYLQNKTECYELLYEQYYKDFIIAKAYKTMKEC